MFQKGTPSRLMSFSFDTMKNRASVWLSESVYILVVWKDPCAPRAPISPGPPVRTGPDQGVNFQCIKNCLAQQASLTCKMGVRGVRDWIDGRTEETVSNRTGTKEMGSQDIGSESG